MRDEEQPVSGQSRPVEADRPFVPKDPPRPGADRNDADDRERPHRGESKERLEAKQRGRLARQARDEGREPVHHLDAPLVARGPFAALAENVREYGIFLLDADGVIVYWGEGARLMKWWTRDQAEGAHLRLLYPEGGSEDGSAEAHLRESAERGEYVGEGQRVRSDGSTFWAGVTLTALRDQDERLIGFAKVTRDLTARLAVESALAMTGSARADRAAALQRAKEALAAGEVWREEAEFAFEQARSAREFILNVLEPELAALRIERANALQRGDSTTS